MWQIHFCVEKIDIIKREYEGKPGWQGEQKAESFWILSDWQREKRGGS